ncbi:MAG: MFS transporter [Candidatus Saccharibacteria bacterium]|nr:MFS transporter [Candidatus Saccharibacteria bacterium]
MPSIFHRLLERRHFWRYASFDEIAELYASRTMRVIAMNIVAGFTSVYLYEAGYSLQFIMGFWFSYYVLSAIIAFFASFFVARFGPKHGILISNLLYVPALIALSSMPVFGVISIILWGVFMAISATISRVSYMTDFSKVKNVQHAGKEIAYMNILEKVSIGISPIIGGFIALWFGLQVVIWVAAFLFALAAVPLFRTIEPTKTKQKIQFSGFPWRNTYRCIIAQSGVGFDLVTTGIVWSMFILIVVFPGAGMDIYVKLGILSSVTIIADITASYAYGKLIDNSKGGSLLKFSVIANSLVHLFRPFVNSPAAIVGTNIVNEAETTGYNMAFLRGVFDTADFSGSRILYLTLNDIVMYTGAAIGCAVLFVLSSLMGNVDGMKAYFFVAAGAVLIIGTAHFRLYRK